MRLALGTVQFGLAYGISNQAGQVGDDALDDILTLARQLGIDTLDTAQAYGNAESRLGSRHSADFLLVDKLAPGTLASEVATSVDNSLRQLARPRLDGLLLHRGQDASPALFEQLMELQRQGKVGKLGVSVYSPDELDLWLSQGYPLQPVSYTHLTLPTIYSV